MTANTEIARTPEKGSRELADQWLALARAGRGTLSETVGEFVETVERVVPVRAGGAKQREVIEAGLAMAQTVALAPYTALGSLARHAILVNVTVDTDVGVDVDVASRSSGGLGTSAPAS
jgi:hypothetical protein